MKIINSFKMMVFSTIKFKIMKLKNQDQPMFTKTLGINIKATLIKVTIASILKKIMMQISNQASNRTKINAKS